MKYLCLLAVAGLVASSGCNDDEGSGDESPADGGTGGAAGTGLLEAGAPPAGGSAGAATDTGGTATGGEAPAGTCFPIQATNPPQQECPGWNTRTVGIPEDEAVTVVSVELPTTMVGGVGYAFTLETISGEADIQVWGSNEACGDDRQALGPNTTIHVEPGRHCWYAIPNSPHSHLIIIRRHEQDYVPGDVITCALGSC